MKYGILFGVAAVLLAMFALSHRDWRLLCLWPAVSFGTISAGYFFLGPSVYGKSQQGGLSLVNTLILLPYLIYLWSVWHVVRAFKREAAVDQLTEKVYVGRRLMGHELLPNIDHVIDLTCEFSEPVQLRSVDYHSFQILDGFVPSTDQLQQWVADAANLSGNIYIHCAEGHGRTGLFAAALLVELEVFSSAEDALEFVQSKRPLVRLGSRQLRTLTSMQFT